MILIELALGKEVKRGNEIRFDCHFCEQTVSQLSLRACLPAGAIFGTNR